jgi:uncharacterized protein (TIGR02996 family)
MSLHPDAEALIRAIFDRPSDDTPKLVLADWLDDTGRPADAPGPRTSAPGVPGHGFPSASRNGPPF